MKTKDFSGYILLTLLMLIMSCADKPRGEIGSNLGSETFWEGLCHGLILPFSLLGKMLQVPIGLNQINHSDFQYWFGYSLGYVILVRLIVFVAVLKERNKDPN